MRQMKGVRLDDTWLSRGVAKGSHSTVEIHVSWWRVVGGMEWNGIPRHRRRGHRSWAVSFKFSTHPEMVSFHGLPGGGGGVGWQLVPCRGGRLGACEASGRWFSDCAWAPLFDVWLVLLTRAVCQIKSAAVGSSAYFSGSRQDISVANCAAV